jgi:hypothetical protein
LGVCRSIVPAFGGVALNCPELRALGYHPPMNDALDTHVLETLRAEFRRLQKLGDRALAQVKDDESFHRRLDEAESNSMAIIIRHVVGNMRSRWTEFLTSDGEKTWRNRDGEFDIERRETRDELLAAWQDGWKVTLAAIDGLTPAQLTTPVTIRGEKLTVFEAITRQLAHYAQHTGQLLLLAKHAAGADWQTLSIPRGQSNQRTYSYRAHGQEKT